jgi:hypothetical protein
MDRDQDPVQQYEIQLLRGGRVVLDATSVAEVQQAPALERQYQLVAAEQGDDVPGHWALAQWCLTHGLKERRQYHLQRLLRHDPDHAPARRALGYNFVGGRWVTQEEYMRGQGYVRYRGKWELPQQVALLEAKREREAAERQWYRQLTLWRRELGTDRHGKYYEMIASIDDPHAIPALVSYIQSEQVRAVRILYVLTLANIGTPLALEKLLEISLLDADEEVIHGCIDRLLEVRHPSIHRQLLETLRHENNFLVNRAAVVLRRLGEEEAVPPLIDALITNHVEPRFNRYSGEWELVAVRRRNAEVLATLIELTGNPGYGYDMKAWKHWRFMQVKQEHAERVRSVPVRRDKQ